MPEQNSNLDEFLLTAAGRRTRHQVGRRRVASASRRALSEGGRLWRCRETIGAADQRAQSRCATTCGPGTGTATGDGVSNAISASAGDPTAALISGLDQGRIGSAGRHAMVRADEHEPLALIRPCRRLNGCAMYVRSDVRTSIIRMPIARQPVAR